MSKHVSVLLNREWASFLSLLNMIEEDPKQETNAAAVGHCEA